MPLTKEVELEYILRRLDGFSIAYFGSSGSFSHVAGKEYFSEESTSFIPYSSIPQVFSAVLSTKADYGVVPIRNSLSGLFRVTHEMLFSTELKVVGEVKSFVKLQLVSNESDLSKITKIYSHPDAISQCQKSLLKYCAAIKTIPVSSTSEGAERASNEPSSAAIAHLDVLKLHPSLRVVQPNMHDDEKGVTQFLILSRTHYVSPSGKDKTLLVFGVKNMPGALTSALGCFDKFQLNLTSIESHFMGEFPLFLIEFHGHMQDEHVVQALNALKNHATVINVIGSFPRVDI